MATAVLGKLRMTLNEPYFIDGYQVHLTISVGAVVYPTDGQTDEELIRRADVALYRAKARSGNARIEALPRAMPVKGEQLTLSIARGPPATCQVHERPSPLVHT